MDFMGVDPEVMDTGIVRRSAATNLDYDYPMYSGVSQGQRFMNPRIVQWLNGIPEPLSPQERYLQGINPSTDHPLHPHAPLPTAEETGIKAHKAVVSPEEPLAVTARKRELEEHQNNEQRPTKRSKLMGSLRRMSVRFPSGTSAQPDEATDMASRRHSVAFTNLASGLKESLRRSASFREKNRMSSVHATGSISPPLLPTPPADRCDMSLNIAVVGAAGVGKSALVRRIAQGIYQGGEYTRNSMQCRRVRTMNRSMRIDVDLYDIGSVREPGEPHPMAVTWYNLVIICLDIGSPCQFEDLTPFRNEINAFEENPIVVLAGLKKDLRRPELTLPLAFLYEPLPLSEERGELYAANLPVLKYLECSAKTGEGVNELWEFVVNTAVERKISDGKKLSKLRHEGILERGAKGIEGLMKKTASKFGPKKG